MRHRVLATLGGNHGTGMGIEITPSGAPWPPLWHRGRAGLAERECCWIQKCLHFLERNHNDTFEAQLDQRYSHWRPIQDELNQTPLGHENWRY